MWSDDFASCLQGKVIQSLPPGLAHESCPAAGVTANLGIASNVHRGLAHNGAHCLAARHAGPRLVRVGAGCMMQTEMRDPSAGRAGQAAVQAGTEDRPSLASKIRG